MAGYNRIVMVGNLTRDPEYKQLPSGQGLCRLGLATNRSFKNRQTGAVTQEVCFVDIDVWGPQADSCRQFLSKGRPVLVEGRLKLDTWQDQQGGTRSKHSIVADRVVFLANAQQAGSGMDYDMPQDEGSIAAPQYTTQATPEFAKIEEAVAKKQASKKAQAKSPESSIGFAGFKDEAPFDEQLPF